eukprot:10343-Heterococcus_DN1.PRE.2
MPRGVRPEHYLAVLQSKQRVPYNKTNGNAALMKLCPVDVNSRSLSHALNVQIGVKVKHPV